MDFFQHRYYKITRVLMKVIGQWPYQNACLRWSMAVVICLLSTSQLIPELLVIYKKHDDFGFVAQCISPLIYVAMCGVKLFSCLWNSKKMLNLLNCIRNDWQVWAQEGEVNFLHDYAEQGRKMILVYTVTLYFSGVHFVAQPMIPKVIDIWLFNDSEPGAFPIPVDYYNIDMQKYYFYIILHIFGIILVGHTIIISCDSIFIVYVQHCCGVFAALGHKLERIGKSERSAETGETTDPLNGNEVDLEDILSCIARHKNAIMYADLMEATYSWAFFFIVGINMIMMSVTSFLVKMPICCAFVDASHMHSQSKIVNRSEDPDAMAQFFPAIATSVGHLFCETYLSQTLIDHSFSVFYSLMNVEWYTLSLKAQKLLLFMMLRSNKPCQLTAGGILVMCVETFWAILKTSLSYFTVLRTM